MIKMMSLHIKRRVKKTRSPKGVFTEAQVDRGRITKIMDTPKARILLLIQYIIEKLDLTIHTIISPKTIMFGEVATIVGNMKINYIQYSVSTTFLIMFMDLLEMDLLEAIKYDN